MRGNGTLQDCNKCHPYFNSRLYMRGNAYHASPLNRIIIFQFTPLHERQRSFCTSAFGSPDFNSRLYMRGNKRYNTFFNTFYIFQFTPLHERQLQKYTIFSIKSTQFSTKPCFFIVTSQKAVFFFNSSSIFLINCIFLPAPMSHKKMYENHQRTHF